jgi:hypothetical protein
MSGVTAYHVRARSANAPTPSFRQAPQQSWGASNDYPTHRLLPMRLPMPTHFGEGATAYDAAAIHALAALLRPDRTLFVSPTLCFPTHSG